MKSDGLGIDIVEFERIKTIIDERFINRVLSDAEKTLYERISRTDRKIEFLAGRFAAKEAYSKAYQIFEEPLNFRDVSILNAPSGAPYVQSKYKEEDTVLISISHSENYAVAVCMLYRGDKQ